MEKKFSYLLFGILSICFGFLLAWGVLSNFNFIYPVTTAITSESINYHGNVIVSTTGAFAGRKTPASQGIWETVPCPLVDGSLDCSNNITTYGKELIKEFIVNGSVGIGATSGNFTFIGLGNSSTTVSDANFTLDGLYNLTTTGQGLNISRADYTTQGNANISIYKTFTSTVSDLKTNVTGLFNGTDGGPGATSMASRMFAWRQFTDVTLQASDQLTVNWSISVS